MDEFNDFPLALREVHTVYIYGIRPYFTTQDFILPYRLPMGLTPPASSGIGRVPLSLALGHGNWHPDANAYSLRIGNRNEPMITLKNPQMTRHATYKGEALGETGFVHLNAFRSNPRKEVTLDDGRKRMIPYVGRGEKRDSRIESELRGVDPRRRSGFSLLPYSYGERWIFGIHPEDTDVREP